MIRLEAVTKQYDDGTVAVDRLSLDVARGELVALVGPSGCGKSTTLRMVNRLIEPTSGRIWLDGVDVTHADPVKLRRGIGYVIQRIGLFPHLSVAGNVACVPDLLGWDAARTRARVGELLDLVGLDPATYGERYPHELSGGQQQRVGVARALAADPPVLLMDEPFGAVDPVARAQLQSRFRRIQAELHKTVLFVTHDIEEAVRLADRIAVFSAGGKLEQIAPPAELLAEPAGEAVATFVGLDRGIRRLVVTPVRAAQLSQPATLRSTQDDLGRAAARLGDDGWAVVLDGDRLAGWIRAGDTPADAGPSNGGAPVGPDGRARTVRPAPPAVTPDDSLHDALAVLLRQDVPWVPVVEPTDDADADGDTARAGVVPEPGRSPRAGRYLGVLSTADVHRALIAR